MNFDYTDTQSMLMNAADRVVKDHSSVDAWRAQRQLPDGCSATMWTLFAELGWLALPLTEAGGGLGGSFEDVAVLMIALGKGLFVEPIVSSVIIGGFLLESASNSGPEYRNYLDKLASGSLRLALAHMEPGERYPALRRCSARARQNAGGFLIDGVKTLVLDAPSANLFILTARIDDTDEVGIFLVAAESSGIHSRAYVLIDGSQAADLHVNSVQVSQDSLLARGSEASSIFAEALDRACIALLAQAVGSMEACVHICGNYLKERKQFGQPIGQFQVLQHMATDMLVAAHQSRSVMYHALANMSGTPTERAKAVSAAKIVVGEGSQTVSRLGVQLHGGYGVTDEYPISHHYRRLTVIEKSYGDIDFHVRRLSALT